MSATDKDDLEVVRLLEEVDKMAKDLVEKVGGYPPFGATIDDQGKVELIFEQSAVTGGATAETLNKVIEFVRRGAQGANIHAASVASMGYMNDPSTNKPTTAMVVALHHRAGRCVDYITPFSKAASGAVRFGKSVAGLGKTKLF